MTLKSQISLPVRIPAQQYKQLKFIAKITGKSMAQIVREALAQQILLDEQFLRKLEEINSKKREGGECK